MKTITASFWVLLTLNVAFVTNVHAGEPWIALTDNGKTPFRQAQGKLSAGSVVVTSAWFEGLPLTATLDMGMSKEDGGDRECAAFTVPRNWPDHVEWTWTLSDGRAADVIVRTARPEVEGANPVVLTPGLRTRQQVTIPSLAPGLYRVAVALKIDGCEGRPGIIRSTPLLIEVFRGTESVEARCALLEVRIAQTSKYEDWRTLMEELAALAPEDTGPYEKLALAAARRDDMAAAVRYHERFVAKVKERMAGKYGAFVNWPSATQKAVRDIEARDKALHEVVALYETQRNELKLTVVMTEPPNEDFALVRRTDGKLIRVLK